MSNLDDNRLVRNLGSLKVQGRRTVLPFLTAGYPDLETTESLLKDFAARGVQVCELGFPFSDPVADGPVIQASYTAALDSGITSEKIFRMVRHFRDGASCACCRATGGHGHAQGAGLGRPAPSSAASSSTAPSSAAPSSAAPSSAARSSTALALVGMVSYSIVFRHGVETFCKHAADAGLDGLIIPDLPLNEAADVEQAAAANGLALVMLVAPTTPPERRLEIARHSRGFVYYVSVAGTTGERDRLPEPTIAGVAELRRHTDTPVCVGFGIAKPDTVRSVCDVADGAIVGSAIVHRVQQAVERKLPREQLVSEVGEFVGQLLAPLK